MESPSQQSLFQNIAAELPEPHRAEFFRALHESGISPNDVELAKLLRVLQLYKSYYESIPELVKKAAAEIERVTKEARDCTDAASLLSGHVLAESTKFRQEMAKIKDTLEAALKQATEDLVNRTAHLLEASVEASIVLPLENRLRDLAASNQGFSEAIAQSKQATEALGKNIALTRRVYIGIYALAGLGIAVFLTIGSWIYLSGWYTDRVEQERAALVWEIGQNRDVLLELAKSHRTLQLSQSSNHPERKLLVMKDALGWQSAGNSGVIEFKAK